MIEQLFGLAGKHALITGSSRGLGLVVAKGMAEAGAAVILNGRNRRKLDEALAGLNAEGLEAQAAAFDILDSDAVEKSIETIERDIGPIDVLVNNAGIQIRAPLEDFSLADWHRIMDANLTAAFVVAQGVARRMIGRRAGKIINICSLQSELGRMSIGPYTASKGGLKMLTRAMATEWGRHNIQINGIGPGYFITEMTQALADDRDFDKWLRGRTPAGRWGDPKELIGTAVYLASDASSFVNGQIVYVDGGIMAAL